MRRINRAKLANIHFFAVSAQVEPGIGLFSKDCAPCATTIQSGISRA